jgi:hypothetical protein
VASAEGRRREERARHSLLPVLRDNVPYGKIKSLFIFRLCVRIIIIENLQLLTPLSHFMSNINNSTVLYVELQIVGSVNFAEVRNQAVNITRNIYTCYIVI